jgi:hypothetical protein
VPRLMTVEAHFVMAGPVPAIHVFLLCQDVDARDKRGHDA